MERSDFLTFEQTAGSARRTPHPFELRQAADGAGLTKLRSIMLEYIEEFENLDRTHIGANDLTDVLTVANLLASFHEFPESIELNMQGVKACERMKLDREAVERILGESSQEVASLRAALGT